MASWASSVEVSAASVHSGTKKKLDEIEKLDDKTGGQIINIYKNIADDKMWDTDSFLQEMNNAKCELHQHVCLSTLGEANRIVRGVRHIFWNHLRGCFSR